VYHNLSISDLMGVDGFKEAYGTKDEATIKRILFENGMDVAKPYEENVCGHRNLKNQHVHCSRYEGIERTDYFWLKESGCATLEAWIASSNDLSFREEMRSLSKETNKSAEREYVSKNYTKE